MMRTTNRLRFLLCCFMIVHFSHAVDYNYYFDGLRSEKPCHSITDKVNCQIKCGGQTGMCIESECYCLSVKVYGYKGVRNILSTILKDREDDQEYSDFHDYTELPDIHEHKNEESPQETPEYLDTSLLSEKPVLRHHIAHFCPNLEVARTCIRTCMKEGKPAFCGKDHVCYCGHKYSNKDKNDSVDASSVYAQFKDLYEKYFGPNYKPEIKV